ncbi:MAG TPA: DUF3109 family protein [Ignavibacteria bacterium]|nr:DUF3109 family protein [Ignavibacteria bacterium]
MEKFIIDDRIFSVKFSCDLGKCKGACCTLKGAGGAPILNEEVNIIKRNVNIVKKYLSREHVEILETEGFLLGEKDDYSINSFDYKDCVFSFYENNIAKCSFQKAYYNGETEFIKPISCHLFPVRIYGDKRRIIRYEELYECEDALIKGEKENISVFEFAKEPLERQYGKELYKELKEKYLIKE